MTHTDTPGLLPWVDERRENCLRLAVKKYGDDRDGWLEDAAYFSAILEALRRADALRTRIEQLEHQLRFYGGSDDARA